MNDRSTCAKAEEKKKINDLQKLFFIIKFLFIEI